MKHRNVGRNVAASLAILVGMVALVAFSGTLPARANALEAFAGERSTREVVSALEADSSFTYGVRAAAFPDRIELASANNERLILEDDYFYASIAPFVNYTHSCAVHIFPGCRGELASAMMHVRITDSGGSVAFEGEIETYENGFMGFWLPRDDHFTIEINYGSYRGVFSFATDESSPTCLTEFQLS